MRQFEYSESLHQRKMEFLLTIVSSVPLYSDVLIYPHCEYYKSNILLQCQNCISKSTKSETQSEKSWTVFQRNYNTIRFSVDFLKLSMRILLNFLLIKE